MSNTELKPCPFCWGEARIIERPIHVYGVECSRCGCRLNQVYRTKEEAIESWNRRANE